MADAKIAGMSEITDAVNKLEMDLLAARKTREVVAYLVPFGDGYTEALAVADKLVTRLRARSLKINVDAAGADNGLALLIEDVSPLATA